MARATEIAKGMARDTTRRRTSWWQLYLIMVVMAVLLIVDYWVPLPNGVHKLGAIAIMVGWGIATRWWLHTHRGALARDEEDDPRDI